MKKNVEKLMAGALAMLMLFGGVVVYANEYSEEVVYEIHTEIISNYVPDEITANTIQPRVHVGTPLFTMTVASLHSGNILHSANRTATRAQIENGVMFFTSISTTHRVGFGHVNLGGTFVSAGSANVSPGVTSGSIRSFNFSFGVNTYRGFIQNTGSFSITSGSVQMLR